MIVPSDWTSGEDVHLEARDNTKIVARTLHSPKKIVVASCAHTDGRAVGQNNIELAEIVATHAIKTLMAPMATPESGAQQADAIAGASGGNITTIPKVIRDLPIIDSTPKPSRLAARLDGDAVEIYQVNLNAVKGPETLRVAVTTIYGQEIDAVCIAVFDLRLQSANRSLLRILVALTMVETSDS